MDSAYFVQRLLTGLVITTIPYLILPLLICSRINKKKENVNYKRVIVINTIIVFVAFFVLHLFTDGETPNVVAAFIWGGVCYAICNNKYSRQRKGIGKESAADQAGGIDRLPVDCSNEKNVEEGIAFQDKETEPSTQTRNESQRSNGRGGRTPFILLVHIGFLVVAGIIVAAFFITGGSLLTEEKLESIIEEAYNSGYEDCKYKKDDLNVLLWSLRASGAYDEGYKTGYDRALLHFVEYADRNHNKNLQNLYSAFVYQGYDDEPRENPYS